LPYPNSVPVFDSQPVVAAAAGEPYRYQARATDPDGVAPSYLLLTGPEGMTLNPATGAISWPPDADSPDRADVVSAIRQISGVASVEDVQASDAGQGRRVRCVVLAGKGKAVAHEVSHLVKAKGWEVESMRVEGGRLDDVFRDLTRISA
jgi:hypothetical protein